MSKAPAGTGLTIGIINYNGAAVVGHVIRSARASAWPGPMEIVVVDDCSTDGSPETIRRDYPFVRLFFQPRNMGPNAARNRALKEARYPLVFVTDNDIELAPDTLSLLAGELLADHTAAVATPMVLDFNNRTQVYSNGAGLHYVCFGIIPLRHKQIPPGLSMEPFGSICGSGGIMMVKRDAALALGGFDEDFVFGYDDGEFTYRVSASGRRVIQVPAARIYHIEKPGRNPKRLRHQIRGRWTLILKTYTARSLFLLAPALAAFELSQIAFLTMKGLLWEWLAGVGMTLGALGSIMKKRRSVMAAKKRPDNQLLAAGEIYMFPSRVGGGFMAALKWGMETALGIYWRVVGPLLSH